MKRLKVKLVMLIALAGFFQDVSAQVITIGSGGLVSVFTPLCRTRDYCAHEMIYLSSQINVTGDIYQLGFYKEDGTNMDSIENVVLYMKHTTQTALGDGTFDTTGYTRVYTGSFPNGAFLSWQNVVLDVPFAYNGTSHLQVLCVKGYQVQLPNTAVRPRWRYTNYSPARARRYFDNIPIDASTLLESTTITAHVRLDFGPVGIVEVGGDKGFLIYPNPSSGNVTVDLPDQAAFKVYDATGKEVYSIRNEKQAFITGLPEGLYIWRMEDGKEYYSGKLIVE